MDLSRVSLSSASQALSRLREDLGALPPLTLSTLPPGETALFLVDLIEGFARTGPLSSPRVESLLAPAAALLRRCASLGFALSLIHIYHKHREPPDCWRAARQSVP